MSGTIGVVVISNFSSFETVEWEQSQRVVSLSWFGAQYLNDRQLEFELLPSRYVYPTLPSPALTLAPLPSGLTSTRTSSPSV